MKNQNNQETLSSFHLKNFKAYKNKQNIKLAPITFLYGPNSAGKSSLIQSILLASQTLNQSTKYTQDLVLQGEYFNAESYKSLVNDNDTKKDIEFGWATKPKGDKDLSDYENGLSVSYKFNHSQEKIMLNKVTTNASFLSSEPGFDGPKQISKEITIPWTKTKPKNAKYVNQIKRRMGLKNVWSIEPARHKELSLEIFNLAKSYYEKQEIGAKKEKRVTELSGNFAEDMEKPLSKKEDERFIELEELKKSLREGESQLKEICENLFLVQTNEKAFPEPPPADLLVMVISSKRRGILVQAEFLFPLIRTIEQVLKNIYRHNALKKPFENFGYLGPLRGEPLRYYPVKSFKDEHVGKKGENWVNNVVNNEDDVKEEISKWCKKLTGYEFNIVSDPQSPSLASVILKKKQGKKELKISIDNVGFGVGQLLPIIAEGLMKKNNLIVVEQPEIHVHPKLQANFADFLINSAYSNKKIKGNNWLIETHSELIALRILKRVREGKIKKDDVAFYYCEPGKKGSNLKELSIDNDGHWLDAWPEGFFDEAFYERY